MSGLITVILFVLFVGVFVASAIGMHRLIGWKDEEDRAMAWFLSVIVTVAAWFISVLILSVLFALALGLAEKILGTK